VLAVVRNIPAGTVSTYGHVALMAGYPGAARQVGWVLSGLSEHDKQTPWQRVINASGRISIRGRGDMAEVQRHLLEQEGIVFDERNKVDLDTYLFRGIT